MKRTCFLCIAIVCTAAVLAASVIAQVPDSISYQGRLTDTGGNPVNATVSIVFTIYDDSTGGNPVWTETQPGVEVTDGLFTVLLGTVDPIPDTAFDSQTRYLGITVGSDSEIEPRTQFVTVPYAYRVSTVDGATGGNITTKVAIGPGHTNTGEHTFVAGWNNQALGGESCIAGGGFNLAEGNQSSIGGGSANTAYGSYSHVGGGSECNAIGYMSAVTGGWANYAIGDYANVGGGSINFAKGAYSSIGGGSNNEADSANAAVGGGYDNSAIGIAAIVAGGQSNSATNRQTAVSGGILNEASGEVANVGGGESNKATGNWSTVPGGYGNHANADHSYAVGFNARSNHDYTYVWNGGAVDSFFSTGNQQYLVNAPGGVGINTNDPDYALHVEGNVDADGFSINGVPIGSGSSLWSQSGSDIYYNSGNVGIGTSTPSDKLDVDGDMTVTGTITSGTNTITIDGNSEQLLIGDGTDGVAYGPPDFVFRQNDDGVEVMSAGLDMGMPFLKLYDPAVFDSSLWRPGGLEFIPESYGRTVFGPEGMMAVWDQTDRDSSVMRADGVRMFHSDDGGVTYDSAHLESGGLIAVCDSSLWRFGSGGISGVSASDDTLMKVNLADITFTSPTGDSSYTAGFGGVSVIWPKFAIEQEAMLQPDGIGILYSDDGGLTRDTTIMHRDGLYIADILYRTDYTSSGLFVSDVSTDDTVLQVTSADIICKSPTSNAAFNADTSGIVMTSKSGMYSGAVSPQGFLFDGNGQLELNASGLNFRNSMDNTMVLISGWGRVILNNSSGVERLRLDENGITFDTTTTPDAFNIAAPGGTTIYSNLAQTTGVQLSSGGGSWASLSDRNLKENIVPIDPAAVLAKVRELQISNWNYSSQDEDIRHMGPMAQDLHAAFGLGDDDRHINSIDADGIALAAIQGLSQENKELKAEIAELRALVNELFKEREER